ncbi:hybrid signal transduction histidine kinase M-like [Nylanderia fulva]|uniref:hybrid signal transduction histidine kinase M-like n=1 Tax=Nylanderia fulva TaxID=613905 RepID=UPI0010FB9D0B|nr:hybrid signal transduction histidine kinase M-like [Nylanderia fulva]XP_029167430.1 hybrid signal transduction histidine kinase M-like [Nylanderia fulva]
MTPPPMLSSVFDPAIERRRSSEVLQTARNLPANIDNILPTVNKKINGNIGDIDSNNNDNKENQIDQTDDIGVLNRNNNINNTVDLETCSTEDLGPQNIAGNASLTPTRNNLFAQNVIFEDFPSDSQNIIKILENTIEIKTLLRQQNEFFEQLKQKNDEPVIFAAAGPRFNNFSTIPTKPFKKHRKLLQYDTSLKNDEDGKKQLETFFYLLGGDSPQDQIKHSLEKMFSNKLAMKCSWKGQKGNFAINSLLLIDIIKKAARKHYPMLTDRHYVNYVSAWLKYAKTRYDREQAKALRNQIG